MVAHDADSVAAADRRIRFEEAVRSVARTTADSMGDDSRARRVNALTYQRCVDEGGWARPLQSARS